MLLGLKFNPLTKRVIGSVSSPTELHSFEDKTFAVVPNRKEFPCLPWTIISPSKGNNLLILGLLLKVIPKLALSEAGIEFSWTLFHKFIVI